MADPKLGPVQKVGKSAWGALQAWDAHGLFPLQYLLTDKPTNRGKKSPSWQLGPQIL